MKQGWTYKKLGDVCDIFNGNSINADYKKKHFYGATGGLPFIATKDVSTIGTIDYDNGVRIPNYTEYKVAPANSVFICAEGGSAGKKFAFVEQDVCFGNKLFCINPKSEKLLGKYVYHYIQSDIFKVQFYSLLTGLIGGVSAKKIQSIEIPIPPLSEQQRIVERLDAAFAHIDELKANAEKQLSEARALFQKALEKAMEPKEGWEEKTLGEVGTFSRGINFAKNDFVKEGFPCIHYGQIHTTFGPVTYEHLSCIPESIVRQDKLASKGNLIIAITSEDVEGSCKCTAWMGDYDIAVGAHAAIFKHLLDPIFVSYFFKSSIFQKEKEPYVHGFKVMEIKPSDIAKIPISFPSKEAQRRIVARLDSLSENVKKLEGIQRKIISECDALKQALLRKVFE